MSRIGKKPVAMPSGVSANVEGQTLTVKGPKGTLSMQMMDDLVKYGSEKGIRDAGKLRLEGKSYVMQDGDVCHFLFNV